MKLKFHLRLVLVLLIGLFSFSLVSAQDDSSGFTLPEIGGGLIESASAFVSSIWYNVGILSDDSSSESIYASLPTARGEDGSFILGDPAAPVTIIEFADFGCPHCQTYKETIDQLVDEYVTTGMARLEYRTFPTAGGQMTLFFGNVQECLEQQRTGAFWESYVLFYESAIAGRYSEDVASRVTNALELDYDAVLTCTETAQQVMTDVNFGIENGVSGTPAVMIRVGDGAAQWIEYQGVVYNRGGAPFEVLAAVVESYQE